MATLRSMVAYLAAMIRYAGIAYIVVQVAIWHSFYADAPGRLVAPALAVAWAAALTAYLRSHWPSPLLACADTAVYVALALAAQGDIPAQVRDSPFSWLVIAMSGQLMIPAWSAPGLLSVPLSLAAPLAYVAGAELWPMTDRRTLTGAAILLLVVAIAHGWGRRALYARAATADRELSQADQAAREEYAALRRNIERREHERLVHDTILNTLTAVARGSHDAVAEVVTRCRQDVALMEAALGRGDDEADDPASAASAASPADDLSEMRRVVADMRARGLTVHFELDDAGGAAVPAPVSSAIANAVREALSNVAVHAGTGEAWVRVRRAPRDGDAEGQCRLRVSVRDQGAGFDLARVDQSRLGVRRSITERAAEYGGQATIRSEPGQGTEVLLAWPAPGSAGPLVAGREQAGPVAPW